MICAYKIEKMNVTSVKCFCLSYVCIKLKQYMTFMKCKNVFLWTCPCLPLSYVWMYISIWKSCSAKLEHISRDHSGYGLSQWETTLQCNIISHWLSLYPYNDHCLRLRQNSCWFAINIRKFILYETLMNLISNFNEICLRRSNLLIEAEWRIYASVK